MTNYLDDMLILSGCGFVIYATSLLSIVAAYYVTGFILIVLGVLVGIGGRKK